MVRLLSKYLLLIALVMGILAPKMTAAVAEIFPGYFSMVICTGDELITLQIGPDGIPVETPISSVDTCAAADIPILLLGIPDAWVGFARTYTTRFVEIAYVPFSANVSSLKDPSRAPPISV